MQTKLPAFLSLIIILSISIFANNNAENLAKQATSNDSSQSQIAIKSLREMNQKGLDTLFDVYKTEIKTYTKTGNKTAEWQKISNAIDNVAMQKDAYSSRLYWHTDIEKAKSEAQQTNKTILTLRLLGNLNEEYSCANSRFFRSILYSNKKIAKELRENYILHWQSVRPAPKVTIDFGDGRQIVRTITGNSIHYILDKNGNVIEAIPGLYNPSNFYVYLKEISRLNNRKLKTKNYWQSYRTAKRNQILAKWQRDLDKLGIKVDSKLPVKAKLNSSNVDIPTPQPVKEVKENPAKSDKNEPPTALDAASLAVTKSAVEIDLVRIISYDSEALKAKTTFKEWQELARLYGRSIIDKNSRMFIKNKTYQNENYPKKDFSALITNLEKYVEIDTVQNEYVFHTKIYEWLNSGEYSNIDQLNNKIYADLFKTPKSDKWLGLYSPDIYSAIENNGVIK